MVSLGVWLTVEDSALELLRPIASSLASVEMDEMFEDTEETRVYEIEINLEGEKYLNFKEKYDQLKKPWILNALYN